MKTILKSAFLIVLLSCGEENHDPLVTVLAARPVTAAREDPTEPVSMSGEVTSSQTPARDAVEERVGDSNIPKNTLCLYDCTTDARAKLVFSASLSYELGGCQTSSARAVDFGSGIRVYIKALCDQSVQLYSLDLDNDGVPKGSLVLISQVCKDARANVRSFDVGIGASRILTVFSCDYTVSNYYYSNLTEERIYARSISLTGTLGEQNLIDSYLPYYSYMLNSFALNLEYNEQATTFGLGFANRFQRLSESGVKLGGVIATGYDNGFLYSSNGSWLVLKTQQGGHCSRISSAGILECNQKSISTLNRQFIGSGRAISLSTDAANTIPVKSLTINPDNCTESMATNLGSLQGSNAKIVTMESGSWSNGISYALYFDTGLGGMNMILADEPRAKILANIPVANYTDISSASVIQRSSGILVFFVSGGMLYATKGVFI